MQKNLSENQIKIINDLINEFETINKESNKNDNSDLISYINNALNQNKKLIEDIKEHNKIQLIKIIEIMQSWISDVQPLLDRFNIKCSFRDESISDCMQVYFKLFKGDTLISTRYLRFNIFYENINRITKYHNVREVEFQTSWGNKSVTREQFKQLLADYIIQVGKEYDLYV